MSALTLRIIACVCMLLDHIGYCFGGRYPFLAPLRWIGRIAFPLYVFLIVNGFRHTSNRLRYALRLAIFAVISQLPFVLMLHTKDTLAAFDAILASGTARQFLGAAAGLLRPLNVFVTLLLALLTVWATDAMRKHRILKYLCFLPTLVVFAAYYYGLIRSDYGAKGILLAMTFYLFDRERFTTAGGKLLWVFLTAIGMLCSIYYSYLISFGFFCLHYIQGRPHAINPPTKWELTQLFSLLALVPIFLYNGKKGKLPASRGGAKAVQLGFYLFYPVHMLALFGIKLLLR